MQLRKEDYFKRVRKIAKKQLSAASCLFVSYSFRPSVRPSVCLIRMEHVVSHWKNFD